MFRKLIPWAMTALLVVLVVAGCSKKPSEYEDSLPTNYAPTSLLAYPDTGTVLIKWVRNAEAEAQSGFRGYYVYCTSRSLTGYGSTTDSIVGLAQLPPESLQYFQVPGCPFTGVDTVTVSKDPLTGTNLAFNTKYYFYVRTMVDDQLSWAGNWVWSCPRPIGYGTIYAYEPTDITNGKFSCYGFKNSLLRYAPAVYQLPTFKWRIKYIDSTYYYPSITTARLTYSKMFVADTSLRYTDTLLADTSVIGFVEWDSLPVTFKTVWKDKNDTSKGKSYDLLVRPKKASLTENKPLSETVDLVLERVPGNSSQVRLTSPLTVSNIPASSAWSKGRETFIQEFPAGYTASVPDPFNTTSYGVILNVGETGNVYQLNVRGSSNFPANNYAKIQIDSVVNSGNTIKVCFRYAFQSANGIKNF
jgi:hypothetical protein